VNGRTARVALAGGSVACGGAALGWAVVAFAAGFTVASTGVEGPFETLRFVSVAVATLVGVVALLVGVPRYGRWNRAATGRPADEQVAVVGAVSLGVAGGLVGVWAAAAFWPDLRVPLVLSVAAVGVLVGVAVDRRRRRATRERIVRLLADGERAVGRTLDVRVRSTDDPPTRLRVRWSFAFVDRAGREHRIERNETFPWPYGPIAGAPVVVLFDPAGAVDARSVFVALRGGDGVGDYVRFGGDA
jgi:hypothetical protein